MGLLKQSWTLTAKNILITVNRHTFSTSIRAFILPIAFIIFLSFAKNLFVPPATFGIGSPTTVRSLQEGLEASSGGRNTLVIVNNGFSGGAIDQVTDVLAQQVTAAGKTLTRASTQSDLLTTCKSSLRGVTSCYGAVVFYSSPTEGQGGIWNYTMMADGALGDSVYVDENTNDVEIYLLPLQRAVDFAIASVNTTVDQSALPATTQEYIYTSITQDERKDKIRQAFAGSIIDVLGVGFLIGMVGVVYHLTGFMSTERELGMSQLIEAMMPNRKRWQPQVARIFSYHLSFTLVYLPGWFIMGVILAFGVWPNSKWIVIVFHILSGLAFTSMSIFGASFFSKAQLSGITIAIITLLLGVIAQVYHSAGDGSVVFLSLLFTPCNYVYFIILMSRFENKDMATSLSEAAPDNWSVKGGVLWLFLIIQIIVYPLLGALVERSFYATTSKGRIVTRGGHADGPSPTTVQLNNFSKHYPPTWFRRQIGGLFGKPRETVVAVNGVTWSAQKGQIMVLLGGNGSGKSTTLDTIVGLNTVTSGTITVDGTGGLGIAPQKNVLWDELTVLEHIRIFSKLKSSLSSVKEGKAAWKAMVSHVDLDKKIHARSKTLSGGQKRKLQLGMMFVGGSAVCCVDEVSSGVDPLSRRRLWDILLAERGSRTIILTTHFLDEADLLADRIVIMSKGNLKAEGSSVELKNELGGGYRVSLHTNSGRRTVPDFHGIKRVDAWDIATYVASTSRQAAHLVRELEGMGIHDYQMAGPTIEDVFLNLAEEVKAEAEPHGFQGMTHLRVPGTSDGSHDGDKSSTNSIMNKSDGLQLISGQPIGFARQAWVMFRKRVTILKRNYLPYATAFFIPIIAAGLVTLFLTDFEGASCTPAESVRESDVFSLKSWPALEGKNYNLLLGPQSSFSSARVASNFGPLLSGVPTAAASAFVQANYVDTTVDFGNYIDAFYANVTPGGVLLGNQGTANSTPLFAWKGNNNDLYAGIFAQNVLDVMLTNISISTQYASFDIPWAPDTGKSLQLTIYFGLAMAAYCAFFSLYPTAERMSSVRDLEYSNGVRSLPLWLAYLGFDFIIVLISSIVAVIIFATAWDHWYHIPYLLPIFIFFGTASTLWSYIISLFARGQLASFALAAASQAALFLIYIIAYLCTLTYAPVDKIDKMLLVVHYFVSIFTPMGSLVRTLFLALNIFSTTCDGDELSANPGGMNQYGAPILYLISQSFVFFGFLLLHESGRLSSFFRNLFTRRTVSKPSGHQTLADNENAFEMTDVSSSSEGLNVMNLTKTFGNYTAVDNLSFGAKHSECFALLGPNGAGKSTTISMIRGDIKPDRTGGDAFIERVGIGRHRAQARSFLGVCPQFDAIDQMTVTEHLTFYARIRGIPTPEHNVNSVIRAVGLEPFRTRMAAALSGGNKRKLSLGIALMGNPSVVLLDEPSSGMDAASKRIMWATLKKVKEGRSLLLTTHSMEEADALADRAGIMARRMLAQGTADSLRRECGGRAYVHLVLRSAPHTTQQEMEQLKRWVNSAFVGAEVEDKVFHGQMRFSVPEKGGVREDVGRASVEVTHFEGAAEGRRSGVGRIILLLEENKESLGLEHYSVSPTTLDQVFLNIVERNNVQEENSGVVRRRRWWKFGLGK